MKGRRLRVPLAAMGVARFAFADLCERPLGPLDFLRIAHAFHTLLIDGIPVLGPARRDIARRFVTLIDTLYDNRVGLIASAEAEPARSIPAATAPTSSSARPRGSWKCAARATCRRGARAAPVMREEGFDT